MFPRTLAVTRLAAVAVALDGMLEVHSGRSLSAPSAGTDITDDWWRELSEKGAGFGLVDNLPVARIP